MDYKSLWNSPLVYKGLSQGEYEMHSVWFDSLHPSQQFFSYIRVEPVLSKD